MGLRSGPHDCRFGFKYFSKTKSRFFGSKESVYAYSCKGQDCSLQYGNFRDGQESYFQANSHGDAGPRRLVIVEDSISSIKVGRVTCAIPLFGSSVSKEKLVRMVAPFEEIVVWLDSDKLNAARQIADRAKLLGKKTRVIYTELDPKYLNP